MPRLPKISRKAFLRPPKPRFSQTSCKESSRPQEKSASSRHVQSTHRAISGARDFGWSMSKLGGSSIPVLPVRLAGKQRRPEQPNHERRHQRLRSAELKPRDVPTRRSGSPSPRPFLLVLTVDSTGDQGIEFPRIRTSLDCHTNEEFYSDCHRIILAYNGVEDFRGRSINRPSAAFRLRELAVWAHESNGTCPQNRTSTGSVKSEHVSQ